MQHQRNNNSKRKLVHLQGEGETSKVGGRNQKSTHKHHWKTHETLVLSFSKEKKQVQLQGKHKEGSHVAIGACTVDLISLRKPSRPAGSDPEVVCPKISFLKLSVSLGGFGPSVAHGKHSVRRLCVQTTKNKAETCSLLDAIGRRSCGR